MTPLYYNKEEKYLARTKCTIKAVTGHCQILQYQYLDTARTADTSGQHIVNAAVWNPEQ